MRASQYAGSTALLFLRVAAFMLLILSLYTPNNYHYNGVLTTPAFFLVHAASSSDITTTTTQQQQAAKTNTRKLPRTNPGKAEVAEPIRGDEGSGGSGGNRDPPPRRERRRSTGVENPLRDAVDEEDESLSNTTWTSAREHNASGILSCSLLHPIYDDVGRYDLAIDLIAPLLARCQAGFGDDEEDFSADEEEEEEEGEELIGGVQRDKWNGQPSAGRRRAATTTSKASRGSQKASITTARALTRNRPPPRPRTCAELEVDLATYARARSEALTRRYAYTTRQGIPRPLPIDVSMRFIGGLGDGGVGVVVGGDAGWGGAGFPFWWVNYTVRGTPVVLEGKPVTWGSFQGGGSSSNSNMTTSGNDTTQQQNGDGSRKKPSEEEKKIAEEAVIAAMHFRNLLTDCQGDDGCLLDTTTTTMTSINTTTPTTHETPGTRAALDWLRNTLQIPGFMGNNLLVQLPSIVEKSSSLFTGTGGATTMSHSHHAKHRHGSTEEEDNGGGGGSGSSSYYADEQEENRQTAQWWSTRWPRVRAAHSSRITETPVGLHTLIAPLTSSSSPIIVRVYDADAELPLFYPRPSSRSERKGGGSRTQVPQFIDTNVDDDNNDEDADEDNDLLISELMGITIPPELNVWALSPLHWSRISTTSPSSSTVSTTFASPVLQAVVHAGVHDYTFSKDGFMSLMKSKRRHGTGGFEIAADMSKAHMDLLLTPPITIQEFVTGLRARGISPLMKNRRKKKNKKSNSSSQQPTTSSSSSPSSMIDRIYSASPAQCPLPYPSYLLAQPWETIVYPGQALIVPSGYAITWHAIEATTTTLPSATTAAAAAGEGSNQEKTILETENERMALVLEMAWVDPSNIHRVMASILASPRTIRSKKLAGLLSLLEMGLATGFLDTRMSRTPPAYISFEQYRAGFAGFDRTVSEGNDSNNTSTEGDNSTRSDDVVTGEEDEDNGEEGEQKQKTEKESSSINQEQPSSTDEDVDSQTADSSNIASDGGDTTIAEEEEDPDFQEEVKRLEGETESSFRRRQRKAQERKSMKSSSPFPGRSARERAKQQQTQQQQQSSASSATGPRNLGGSSSSNTADSDNKGSEGGARDTTFTGRGGGGSGGRRGRWQDKSRWVKMINALVSPGPLHPLPIHWGRDNVTLLWHSPAALVSAQKLSSSSSSASTSATANGVIVYWYAEPIVTPAALQEAAALSTHFRNTVSAASEARARREFATIQLEDLLRNHTNRKDRVTIMKDGTMVRVHIGKTFNGNDVYLEEENGDSESLFAGAWSLLNELSSWNLGFGEEDEDEQEEAGERRSSSSSMKKKKTGSDSALRSSPGKEDASRNLQQQQGEEEGGNVKAPPPPPLVLNVNANGNLDFGALIAQMHNDRYQDTVETQQLENAEKSSGFVSTATPLITRLGGGGGGSVEGSFVSTNNTSNSTNSSSSSSSSSFASMLQRRLSAGSISRLALWEDQLDAEVLETARRLRVVAEEVSAEHASGLAYDDEATGEENDSDPENEDEVDEGKSRRPFFDSTKSASVRAASVLARRRSAFVRRLPGAVLSWLDGTVLHPLDALDDSEAIAVSIAGAEAALAARQQSSKTGSTRSENSRVLSASSRFARSAAKRVAAVAAASSLSSSGSSSSSSLSSARPKRGLLSTSERLLALGLSFSVGSGTPSMSNAAVARLLLANSGSSSSSSTAGYVIPFADGSSDNAGAHPAFGSRLFPAIRMEETEMDNSVYSSSSSSSSSGARGRRTAADVASEQDGGEDNQRNKASSSSSTILENLQQSGGFSRGLSITLMGQSLAAASSASSSSSSSSSGASNQGSGTFSSSTDGLLRSPSPYFSEVTPGCGRTGPVALTSACVTVSGLLPSHAYTFRVASITPEDGYAGSASPPSPVVATLPLTAPPPFLHAIEVTVLESTSVYISWKNVLPADLGGLPLLGVLVARQDIVVLQDDARQDQDVGELKKKEEEEEGEEEEEEEKDQDEASVGNMEETNDSNNNRTATASTTSKARRRRMSSTNTNNNDNKNNNKSSKRRRRRAGTTTIACMYHPPGTPECNQEYAHHVVLPAMVIGNPDPTLPPSTTGTTTTTTSSSSTSFTPSNTRAIPVPATGGTIRGLAANATFRFIAAPITALGVGAFSTPTEEIYIPPPLDPVLSKRARTSKYNNNKTTTTFTTATSMKSRVTANINGRGRIVKTLSTLSENDAVSTFDPNTPAISVAAAEDRLAIVAQLHAAVSIAMSYLRTEVKIPIRASVLLERAGLGTGTMDAGLDATAAAEQTVSGGASRGTIRGGFGPRYSVPGATGMGHALGLWFGRAAYATETASGIEVITSEIEEGAGAILAFGGGGGGSTSSSSGGQGNGVGASDAESGGSIGGGATGGMGTPALLPGLGGAARFVAIRRARVKALYSAMDPKDTAAATANAAAQEGGATTTASEEDGINTNANSGSAPVGESRRTRRRRLAPLDPLNPELESHTVLAATGATTSSSSSPWQQTKKGKGVGSGGIASSSSSSSSAAASLSWHAEGAYWAMATGSVSAYVRALANAYEAIGSTGSGRGLSSSSSSQPSSTLGLHQQQQIQHLSGGGLVCRGGICSPPADIAMKRLLHAAAAASAPQKSSSSSSTTNSSAFPRGGGGGDQRDSTTAGRSNPYSSDPTPFTPCISPLLVVSTERQTLTVRASRPGGPLAHDSFSREQEREQEEATGMGEGGKSYSFEAERNAAHHNRNENHNAAELKKRWVSLTPQQQAKWIIPAWASAWSPRGSPVTFDIEAVGIPTEPAHGATYISTLQHKFSKTPNLGSIVKSIDGIQPTTPDMVLLPANWEDIHGRIAFIERGPPLPLSSKIRAAADAGALAVIIMDDAGSRCGTELNPIFTQRCVQGSDKNGIQVPRGWRRAKLEEMEARTGRKGVRRSGMGYESEEGARRRRRRLLREDEEREEGEDVDEEDGEEEEEDDEEDEEDGPSETGFGASDDTAAWVGAEIPALLIPYDAGLKLRKLMAAK